MAEVGKSPALARNAEGTAEYLFHLDAFPPRIGWSKRLAITGWLFHREGKPIHGLRGVVKSSLRSARIYKARRKRARPAIGVAYPHLPEASMSGFLLELDDLPFGRCELELQVKDHEKIWRSIFATRLQTFPLDFLGQMRLREVERFAVAMLSERCNGASPILLWKSGELDEIKRRMAGAGDVSIGAVIRTIHLFVTSKSNLFIVEIAELLCAGFRAAGLAATLFVDRIPAEDTPNDTLQIIVTPHEFYNLFLTSKIPAAQIRRLTQQLFLLGTEQPDSDWFHSNLVIAPYARAMLDINPLGVASYRECGLRCFHLPLGYDPMLERTVPGEKFSREIDICFLAALTKRREKFLAANADFFSQHNCHLRLVPITFAKTKETKSYLSGETRNALLQRSKILLNVHYSDLRYFEWHRMLLGLANGCCIITESCEGFAPLIPGQHFVMVEREQLTRCCEYYLQHPDEREAIAQAGRTFIRAHLRQADNCLRCVEQITQRADSSLSRRINREASLQRALPEPLEKRIGHGNGHLFWRALRHDLQNLFRSPERAGITAGQAFSDPATDAKFVQAIKERRRGYADRFAFQSENERNGAEIFRVSDNDFFRATPPAAISVIITLYNYPRYIRPCVASLDESSIAGIPGGIEVLIVDDASTDQSLRQAQRAQRDSKLPVRIIAKKWNTGLADARNVGLRLARARYAFIMDADNLVFPRALEQLYLAITAAEAAAAYSILCRFQGRPNNRIGLLSYFDWDPGMLVEHPYIDAMALFDRPQLLDLGGYDNELFKIGWFGWEDYELWLRMAAAHLHAVLLPNVLCLYRHHESSMSNTTNLFENDLVRHLIARYQPLLDEYQPKERVFGVEWSRLQPNEPSNLRF